MKKNSTIKETTKIKDCIEIVGGKTGDKSGGIKSSDGSPLCPKKVAKAFGVSLEDAKNIIRRLSL